VGFVPPKHGNLASWARQGVLMLNTVLTVREGEPNSHQNRGWETFTDAVLGQVLAKPKPVLFLLWGNYAKRKASQIEDSHKGHVVLSAGHPSPLSVKHFRGCHHFSQVNAHLKDWGEPPIVWQIPQTGL
jgi:uracil-DNA glycosylase